MRSPPSGNQEASDSVDDVADLERARRAVEVLGNVAADEGGRSDGAGRGPQSDGAQQQQDGGQQQQGNKEEEERECRV